MSLPLLPPELERDIFELAARTHRGTAVNLTLVARRVQIWIERVIYEVVSLSDRNKCGGFLRTLNARPVQFFDEHVKALCLPYYLDMDQASRILSVCRHVNNLECWAQRGSSPFSLCSAPQLGPPSSSSPSSTFPQTAPVPLLPCPSRLSVNMRDLFHSSPPDFSLPLFANITHLRVADSWLFWSTWPSFAPIPILTHLALEFSGAGPAHIPRLAPVLVRILAECEKLRVCVLYTNRYELADTAAALRTCGLKDPRVALLACTSPVENWEASVLRGDDRACQWALAEELVLKQRKETKETA